MISQRCKELKPSPTMALTALAGELKSEGHDVIALSVGEPDWDTFSSVKAAGIAAIEEGKTKYMPAAGLPDLRKAIAERMTHETKVEYDFKDITVSTGAKFIVFGALQALIDPQDEVVIPAPFWVSYPDMVKLAGGVPKIITCDQKTQFKLSADELEASVSEKTKAIVLNSPCNPTGEVYSLKEWQEIAAVLKKHPDIVIISDDIYNRLYFEGEIAPHILNVAPELKDRTIVINGVSKSHAMTGWRLGWAAGPREVISAMTRYQSQSVSCACSITQAAALFALKNCDQEMITSVEKLHRRLDLVFNALKELEGIRVEKPKGAFYCWLDISAFLGRKVNGHTVQNSEEFSQRLLADQKVAATAGVHFGLEGYLRVSYALSDERMLEAVRRIGDFIKKFED